MASQPCVSVSPLQTMSKRVNTVFKGKEGSYTSSLSLIIKETISLQTDLWEYANEEDQ